MATTTALTNEGKQAKPLTQALCRITVERSGYELNSIQLQFIYLLVLGFFHDWTARSLWATGV